MKKLPYIVLFLTLISFPEYLRAQTYYQTTDAYVSFYSSAPVEDIQAESEQGVSVVNIKTGEISFQVRIRSFDFPKELMEEHFNENYMESAKYPKAIFKGKAAEPINKSSGNQDIVFEGVFSVHGVEQKRKIPATIKFNGDQMLLKSKFNVAVKDHDIKIPRLLWQNIAEVIEVTVNANFKSID
ncbi:YceI family protein [Salegentibacter chungangensis]|uniref:YceI family protein n=1 Tax=Salegentibacter chungangensis TaxID=1335724 RepID=A0ABW3NMF1_9FLAO